MQESTPQRYGGAPWGARAEGPVGAAQPVDHSLWGGGGMQPHTPYDCRLRRSGATKPAKNLRPQQSSPSTRNAGDANGIARLGDFLRFLSGLFLRVSIPPLSNGVGWVATCPCAFPEAYVSFSCTRARNISSTKRTWSALTLQPPLWYERILSVPPAGSTWPPGQQLRTARPAWTPSPCGQSDSTWTETKSSSFPSLGFLYV